MSTGKERAPVIVIGGGITGLTAAHELAERGFAVRVIEEAEDFDSDVNTPALGGMARTQWAWRPGTRVDTAAPGTFLPTYPRFRLEQVVYFHSSSHTPPDDEPTKLLLDQVAATIKDLPEPQHVYVYVEGFASDEPDVDALSLARAKGISAELICRGVDKDRLKSLGLGDSLRARRLLEPKDRRRVSFRVLSDLFPGEHGYRFFPSFYHHVFDTMKRTPILANVRSDDVQLARDRANHRQPLVEEDFEYRREETPRTAYDNLHSMPAHALAADDEKPPAVLSRQITTSLEELRQWATLFFEDLGFKETDVSIFMGKIFKFATSCDERRREQYESISWMEFIDSPEYSERFRLAMNKWPHSLVALRADECDAHTHGLITIQLLLDQLRRDFTDGTLTGPTSSAWIEPWKRYLYYRHDVEFERARVSRLWVDSQGQLRIESTFYEDGQKQDDPGEEVKGFCVVALPVEVLSSVMDQSLLDAVKGEVRRGPHPDTRNDIEKAVNLSIKLGGRPPPCGPRAREEGWAPPWNHQRPEGALRHFSGVQFYFEEDIDWVEGHTYYLDSAWGLSSVAQTSRWQSKMSRRSPFRAIVSVDIGIFDKEGSSGRTAWQCTRKELAEEVWRQVKAGAESKDLTLPDPAYYHVDDNLVPDPAGGIKENKSPFLVPLKDEWSHRPGEPDDYRVYLGRMVLAGTFMKTYTRLTTMEAANESARHAVNAILRHIERRGASPDYRRPSGVLCKTLSLEAREAPDARFWKDVDRKLFLAGKEHFMDILDWKTWPVLTMSAALKIARRLLLI